MPFASHRPAPNVEQAINSEQAALNASRFIPRTPELYREIAEQNKVFIFNVGPWAHRRDLGSAGSFFVKACPEGKPYSEPVVILGVVEEPYPINEAECKVMTETGRNLALQVLGEGPFIPRSSSFSPYGVFLSSTPEPSEEALAEAHKKLNDKYRELVKEASDAYAKGPVFAEQVISPDYHFIAARKLKKSVAECPWLANTQEPEARISCPGCGDPVKAGVVVHKECGWIFDREKWEANHRTAKKG
jgi:hypothetical protein